jgi:hypothetical protein
VVAEEVPSIPSLGIEEVSWPSTEESVESSTEERLTNAQSKPSVYATGSSTRSTTNEPSGERRKKMNPGIAPLVVQGYKANQGRESAYRIAVEMSSRVTEAVMKQISTIDFGEKNR